MAVQMIQENHVIPDSKGAIKMMTTASEVLRRQLREAPTGPKNYNTANVFRSTRSPCYPPPKMNWSLLEDVILKNAK